MSTIDLKVFIKLMELNFIHDKSNQISLGLFLKATFCTWKV